MIGLSDRKKLKSQIPYGYTKKVSEKAGTTPSAVSYFLAGKTNSRKIYLAVLEVIAELQLEERRLIKAGRTSNS